jgi:hypothetical protein
VGKESWLAVGDSDWVMLVMIGSRGDGVIFDYIVDGLAAHQRFQRVAYIILSLTTMARGLLFLGDGEGSWTLRY